MYNNMRVLCTSVETYIPRASLCRCEMNLSVLLVTHLLKT